MEEWIAWRVIKLGEVLDLEKASNGVFGSSGEVLDLVQKAWAKQKFSEDSTKCTNKGSDESLSGVDKGLHQGSNQVPNLIVHCQD